MAKPLVVILCETRSHEVTYEPFQKHVLDALGADLALCIAQNDREDTSNEFYKNAKYIWSFEEKADLTENFEEIVPDLHRDWREYGAVPDQWLGPLSTNPKQDGSGGIQMMMRAYLRKMLIKEDLLKKYSHIIVARSDALWVCDHPPLRLLMKGGIWAPNGENYRGLVDRHTVLSSDVALDALNWSKILTLDPKIGIPLMLEHKTRWNPESLHKFTLMRADIYQRVRKIPYVMFSIRLEGGHTRWVSGKFDAELGYHIKYQNEFERALFAQQILGDKPWTRPKMKEILDFNARRIQHRAKYKKYGKIGRFIHRTMYPLPRKTHLPIYSAS